MHEDLGGLAKMADENAAKDGYPQTDRSLELCCKYPAHAGGDLHPQDEQRPSCKVVFSASGEPPGISVGCACCLGTGMLWPWTDGQVIAVCRV